jgi:hypothetical protein
VASEGREVFGKRDRLVRRLILGSVAMMTLAVLGRMFLGVYSHDEFGDDTLFIKHRPVWKWYFYSPIGMSDRTMEELPPAAQQEQRYFNEFVKGQGLSR